MTDFKVTTELLFFCLEMLFNRQLQQSGQGFPKKTQKFKFHQSRNGGAILQGQSKSSTLMRLMIII